jgi:hypothetical protein
VAPSRLICCDRCRAGGPQARPSGITRRRCLALPEPWCVDHRGVQVWTVDEWLKLTGNSNDIRIKV